MPHYIALTCGALARAVYTAASVARSVISVQILDQGLHNTPSRLRGQIQQRIDAIHADQADAILLVYGLCGNATLGLIAREIPLIIPRAHDCITLYLGSRTRYQQEIGKHPGTYWYSQDYLERNRQGDSVVLGASENVYQRYVEKYGRDNADFLMEAMSAWTAHYTRLAFIETGAPDAETYRTMAEEKAAQRGLRYESVEGDPRLVNALIHGCWDTDEFLIVPPHHLIVRGNDDQIISAAPV